MNIAEALSREIERVTEIKGHYEEIGLPGRPALKLVILPALEMAHKAAGSNDPIAVVAAVKELREIRS